MEDAEVLATVALSLVPGVGSQRLRLIVATFGSAQAALDAPQSRLQSLEGIGRAAASAIKAARPEDGARVLSQLASLGGGARVLVSGQPDFPAQLDEIHDPPPLLYVWGDTSLLRQPTVAIVGSRDHTLYGAEAARILATAVAQRAVIVSGMARGIDAIAHTAALDRSACSATDSASSILPPIARCTNAWWRTAASSPSIRPASARTPARSRGAIV
jgi:DNA processing protein